MTSPQPSPSPSPRPEALDALLSNTASPSLARGLNGTSAARGASSRTHSRNPSASSTLTVGTTMGGGANLRRHQRQRSSISVKAKKRLSTQPTSPSLASLPEPHQGGTAASVSGMGVTNGSTASDSLSPSDRPRRPPTPPDNALSSASPALQVQPLPAMDSAAASAVPPAGGAADYFSSLAPYSHSTNSTPAQVATDAAAAQGRAAEAATAANQEHMQASQVEAILSHQQGQDVPLPEPPTSSGLVTTRTELSLFDDDDDEEEEEVVVAQETQPTIAPEPVVMAVDSKQQATEVPASFEVETKGHVKEESEDPTLTQTTTAQPLSAGLTESVASQEAEAKDEDSDSESNDPTTPKVTQQSFPGGSEAEEQEQEQAAASIEGEGVDSPTDAGPPPAVPPKAGLPLPLSNEPEVMATPPMVPAKDVPSLPSSPWLRQESATMGSSSPLSVASGSPRAWNPRARAGSSAASASSGVVDVSAGPSRRLSLLAGDSVVGGSRSMARPSQQRGGGGHSAASSSISSPSSSAFMTAVGGLPTGPSTPSMGLRRASAGKKAGLAYIASPSASPAVDGALRSPKTIQAPWSASTSSDAGGSNGTGPGTPGAVAGSRLSGITTASSSTAGSSGADSARSSGIVAKVLPIQAGRKEDGETVMTSHRDLLAAIASKERRCAELKEELKREEAELKELHKSFQSSAARELYSESAAAASNAKGAGASHRSAAGWQNGSVSSISTLPSLDGQVSRRESDASILSISEHDAASQSPASDLHLPISITSGSKQQPVSPGATATASDAWKSLSGKISTGLGSQLNAFLDQLASPAAPAPPEKGNAGLGSQNKPVGAGKGSDVRGAMRAKASRPATEAKVGGLAALTEEGSEGMTSPTTTSQHLSMDRATSPSSSRRTPSESSVSLASHLSSPSSNTTAIASEASGAGVAATTMTTTPKHAKRTSMFGSFSAFQKQVEQQLQQALLNNPPPVVDKTSSTHSEDGIASGAQEATESSSAAAAAVSSGWSAWQKKLKEAKESASGLLATAEKKLGQAMTIDDLLFVSTSEEKGGNVAQPGVGGATNLNRSGSNASGRNGNGNGNGVGIGPLTGGFSEQNERERQALDELWGHNRRSSSSSRPASSSVDSPETQTRRLSPSMLLELESGSGVVPLRSPSGSGTSTSGAGASPSSAGNRRENPPSSTQPQPRPASTSPTSEKRNSAFLSLFWGNADEETSASSTQGGGYKPLTPHAGAAPRRKLNGISNGGTTSGTGSGQSKSRLAAQLATQVDSKDKDREEEDVISLASPTNTIGGARSSEARAVGAKRNSTPMDQSEVMRTPTQGRRSSVLSAAAPGNGRETDARPSAAWDEAGNDDVTSVAPSSSSSSSFGPLVSAGRDGGKGSLKPLLGGQSTTSTMMKVGDKDGKEEEKSDDEWGW